MGWTFSQPWILWALGAIAIPIAIHLLRRRRLTPMRFSSIQFFLNTEETNRRRRRIRRWALLALRALALAAIILALADPRRDTGEGESVGAHLALVMDGSLSLRMGDRWERALRLARDELAILGPNDRVTLIDARHEPETNVEFGSAEDARSALRRLSPGVGAAQLGDAVAAAAALAVSRPGASQTLVRLISDGQRSELPELDGVAIPEGVDFAVRSASIRSETNLAVTKIESAGPGIARATIQNFSTERALVGTGQWSVDGVAREDVAIDVGPGGVARPRLRMDGADSQGARRVSLAVEVDDALLEDNALSVVFDAWNPLTALVAVGGSEDMANSQFFETAIVAHAAKGFGLAEPGSAVRTTALNSLAAAVVSASPDLVVFAPFGAEPPTLVPALETFVREGGALLLFSHPLSHRSKLMREDWIPVGLDRVEDPLLLGPNELRLLDSDRFEGPLAVFRSEAEGGFREPDFENRWRVELRPGAEPVVRFRDNMPLVALRDHGDGRVVWVNTTLDSTWSDWPSRRSYVPWIDGLMALASARQRSEASEYPVVEALRSTRLEGIEESGRLHIREFGGSSDLDIEIEQESGALRIPALSPGVYEVTDSSGQAVSYIMSRLPIAESDPEVAAAGRWESAFRRVPDTSIAGLEANLSETNSNWLRRALLFAALALLLGEMAYGNRLVG